jgi:hypothetical protein
MDGLGGEASADVHLKIDRNRKKERTLKPRQVNALLIPETAAWVIFGSLGTHNNS